jgi:hypothetical protein
MALKGASVLFAAAACGLTVAGAVTADAACTRLGFSVNDYGKEGPTRDAQDLLDKHIAQWTKERGISKYSVGKKDVTCELFLDFIVFDEHTCKAEATVCWDGPPVAASPSPAVSAAKSPRPAKKAP